MSPRPPLRLLLFLTHGGYMRVYEPVVRLLAERGHTVHVAFSSMQRQPGGRALAVRLSAEFPAVTYAVCTLNADEARGRASRLRLPRPS